MRQNYFQEVVEMANVAMELLYAEIRQVHKEVHALRERLVPELGEEKISAKERKELDAIYADVRKGNATPWREVLRKK